MNRPRRRRDFGEGNGPARRPHRRPARSPRRPDGPTPGRGPTTPPSHGSGEVGPRCRGPLQPGPALETPQQGEHGVPAGSGRDALDAVSLGEQSAEAVAAPGGEEPGVADRRQGQVVLLAAGGAEVEAGGGVDHRPRLELPVGLGVANVGGVRHGVVDEDRAGGPL